jgi:hypothetical protein
MVDSNIFRGYYDILDEALDIFPISILTTLEFVRRKDVHSVVIYIRNNSEEIRQDIDTFLEKYGFSVPRRLYETGPEGTRTGLIAIDLGTLTTDNLRLYVTTTHNKPTDNLGKEWHWGTGYYLDKQGNVLGKKHYHMNLKQRIMKIDYFDSENNLKSSGTDYEHITDDWTVWGGPEALYNIVKDRTDISHQFCHKTEKDQGYFIVSIPGERYGIVL